MSKSIGISGVYKNGVHIHRGLHCGKHAEVYNRLFEYQEISLLINRFYTELGDKLLKGDVEVHLRACGKRVQKSVTMTIHRHDLHAHTNLFVYFFRCCYES